MHLLLIPVAIAPAVVLLLCALAAFRTAAPAIVRGIGWIALWTFPVACFQAVGPIQQGAGAGLLLIVAVGWWVLTGGWVAVSFFELSLESSGADRESTMLDHGFYMLGLCAIVALVLGAIAGHLLRGEPLRDAARRRPVLFVGAAAFANAALAVTWPWWGT